MKDERGFTVVELLVTLVLLGLMTAFLFDGFRFGTRAWESSSRQLEEINRVQAVQNLLRRELNRAVVSRLAFSSVDGNGSTGFAGESDRLRFLAPLPSHQGIGGLYLFSLEAELQGGTENLTLSWCLYRFDWNLNECDKPDGMSILLTGIGRLNVFYLDDAIVGTGSAWRSSWQDTSRLPGLIRIEIGFDAHDRRQWPSLVVAPMARQL